MSTVGHGPSRVKRPYDASRRRAGAEASRRRVLEAAERRFLAGGYASTTIGAIAADAQVSADSIYKSFGGKPGLIRSIYADALRGREALPAEVRSDEVQRAERDPRAILRAFGGFVAELSPRAAPLALLVRSAAQSHPELQPLVKDIAASRLRRMTENAQRLAAAGHLRADVTVERAADVMWLYSEPDLYELLVLQRGFTLERFGEFVADAMIAALI